MANILDIDTLAIHDDSIIKKEFYPYTPYTTSFNESDEIRIAIQSKDSYLLPSESYIHMQIAAITNGVRAADDPEIHFVNNFTSFLFSDARYELNGVEIDRIRNVGRASTLKLLCASRVSQHYSYASFSKGFEGVKPRSDTEGGEKIFDVVIPLSIWFPFCDDYRKIILNAKHELVLNRSRQSLDCTSGGVAATASAVLKVVVTKIEWKMPHVTLSDHMKLNMMNYLAKNKKIAIQHRSLDMVEYPELPQTTHHIWSIKTVSNLQKPRFVLVGLQTNRNGVRVVDASKFDSCSISQMRLHLNSQIFPYNMSDIDIGGARYAELFHNYSNIQSSYYNDTEAFNPFAISFPNFQGCPIFAFDTSRSDESLLGGSVDIRLEIKTMKNIPANTTAFCLIIYENEHIYSPFDSIVVRNI